MIGFQYPTINQFLVRDVPCQQYHYLKAATHRYQVNLHLSIIAEDTISVVIAFQLRLKNQ